MSVTILMYVHCVVQMDVVGKNLYKNTIVLTYFSVNYIERKWFVLVIQLSRDSQKLNTI